MKHDKEFVIVQKAAPRLELGVKVLQTSALPLGYAAAMEIGVSLNDYLVYQKYGRKNIEAIAFTNSHFGKARELLEGDRFSGGTLEVAESSRLRVLFIGVPLCPLSRS